MLLPTLDKDIEDGMSCFEVLQYKMTSLQTASRKQHEKIEAMLADIESMNMRLNSRGLSRYDRFNMEADLKTMYDKLQRSQHEYSRTTAELTGMRKAFDVILMIHNTGGEINSMNRRKVETILDY